MIEASLRGLFPPEFPISQRVNLSELMRKGAKQAPPPDTKIHDARELQQGAVSEHDFLEEHGFVLLNAPTAVRDWSDAAEVAIYAREIEDLVRNRLYPGRRLTITQPPFVVRRGAGTDNPNYAVGVHQDHGLTADDYQHNVEAFAGPEIAQRWRESFDQDDIDTFITLDFWRTTNMPEPLSHMPLALCDPSTVDTADIIPTAFEGIAPNNAVTHHVGLRFNPGQRWYFYPRMTADEVLVFKIFQLTRHEEPQVYRACFHSAVADPGTPPDAQPRQSCEHRVGVMLEG